MVAAINSEHIKELESEAIFVLREVASQFEKPVLLFSGGKDSILLAYLSQKAFCVKTRTAQPLRKKMYTEITTLSSFHPSTRTMLETTTTTLT